MYYRRGGSEEAEKHNDAAHWRKQRTLLFVTEVQGVVASYAEFLPKLHSIKGIWPHGSLLPRPSRCSISARISRTRAVISIMRDVFVQETTFASLSAR